MTSYVSSFKEVEIGKYKYTFYFVACPEVDPIDDPLPSKEENWVLDKPKYQELEMQARVVGREMENKGDFVLAYEDEALSTASQVLDKDWPTQLTQRMMTTVNPFVLVINENFAEFNPAQSPWLMIWKGEAKWPAYFSVLRWIANLARKGEDLFEYFQTRISKQRYENLTQSFGKHGSSVDATEILEKDGRFIRQFRQGSNLETSLDVSRELRAIQGTINKEQPMDQSTVFISYSHKDEDEKDALLTHLGVLQHAGLVEVWNDDRIGAGVDWEQEIEQVMAQVGVAVLLITANFLTSDFILKKEVPELLRRRQREGVVVFPVIAKSCAWKEVEWLAKMNVRPKNGRPVWGDGGSHVDEDLAAVAQEVASIVRKSKVILEKSQYVSKPRQNIDKSALRRRIVARYSLEGIRTLCEDTGVDYEELGQSTKESLARELIRELERLGQLDKLEDIVKQR